MFDTEAELDEALLLLFDILQTDAMYTTPGTLELEAKASDLLEQNLGRVQFLLQQRKAP